MKNVETYGRDDRPIDWSSFDEPVAGATGPVSGSKALKAFSILMIVVCVIAVIAVLANLGPVLSDAVSVAQSSNGGLDAVASMAAVGNAFAVLAVAALTLIPAAFALQAASGPSSTTAALVLGIVGIVLPLATFALAPLLGTYLWLLMEVPAVVYLALVLWVRHGQDEARRRSDGRASRKDELWDEDKIWS